MVALVLTFVGAHGLRTNFHQAQAVDAIEYVLGSLEAFPIVCLAEGGHAAREPHEFLRRLFSNREVLAAVDVIIVEFAAGMQQPVLDAYIRGEDVSVAALSRVWRDTQQSPIGPWDSPLYRELLQVIREGNQHLPPGQRARVLAGDPPINWEQIRTRDDFLAAQTPRDRFVAELAEEQAFELGKRVLILFGGAHLPRVQIAPGDLRNSLTSIIISEHPGSVRAIGFLNPENLNIQDRIDEFERGSVYPLANSWVGTINAGVFFPTLFSPVVDPETGQEEWQQVRLYEGHEVRDLFDALVYVGPSSQWETVPGVLDPARDADYLAELDRRSMVRFGRPYVPDGR